MNAVIYGAKSTEDKHGSIPTQLEDCRALAEREGWDIVGEESDEGFSAYHGNRGDGLARAKAAAVEHAPSIIVVQDLDRLARGAGDAPNAADHLGELFFAMKRQSVTLWSARTGQVDSIRAVLEGERSHSESARKAQAVEAGIKRRKDRGAPVGAMPFGYSVEKHVVEGQVIASRVANNTQVVIARETFAQIATGASPGEVARKLNASGITTRRGGTWTARAIRQLIRNDAYRAGSGYPRIVDDATWTKANAQLRRLDPAAVQKRKGGRPTTDDYLLRGVAFCRCGAPLYATTGRYGPDRGRAYVCRDKLQSTGVCDAPAIPAAVAEEHVIDHLEHFVGDVDAWLDDLAAERSDELAQREAATDRARAALTDMERKIRDAEARLDANLGSELADTYAGAVARLEVGRAAHLRTVADTEAAAAEFAVTPNADSYVWEFYRDLFDLFRGKLTQATGAGEVNRMLHDVLSSMTLWQEAGQLRADFQLRVERKEPASRDISKAGFSPVTLTPMVVAA